MYSTIPFTNSSQQEKMLSFQPDCRLEGCIPEILRNHLANAAARHSSADGRVPFILFEENPTTAVKISN